MEARQEREYEDIRSTQREFLEVGQMIRVLAHDNAVVAKYRGEILREDPVKPDPNWIVLNGKRVPIRDLEELFLERMLFDWRGQPFKITKYSEGSIAGLYLGGSDPWARQQKLKGDQYSGWYGLFQEFEIDNVRVERTDLLAEWHYQTEMGTPAPPGLYTDVRAATSEEWVREPTP